MNDHAVRKGRRHRIVCIDNEPAVLSALRRLFRAQDVDLLTTDSPREALQWIRQDRISLLITDQRMPELSGEDVARAVAEDSPQTPVLLITAFPDLAIFRECARYGIRSVIGKPWDDNKLRRTVQDLLREVERQEAL